MLWEHHIVPQMKMAGISFFIHLFPIGADVYLLAPNQNESLKIFKMDPMTMAFSEFVPDIPEGLKNVTAEHATLFGCVSNGEYIILNSFRIPDVSLIFSSVVVNTTTREVKLTETQIQNPEFLWELSCAANNKMYVFGKTVFGELTILTLNLETLKWAPVIESSMPIELNIVANDYVVFGNDICFLSGRSGENDIYVMIFNTLNNQWTRIEHPKCDGDFKKFRSMGNVLENELFLLTFESNMREPQHVLRILDLNKKQWGPSYILNHFSPFIFPLIGSFVVNDKICYFENDTGDIAVNINTFPKETRFTLRAKNDPQLHVLHLNPTLQTMCKAVIMNYKLDIAKLPKSLQETFNNCLYSNMNEIVKTAN